MNLLFVLSQSEGISVAQLAKRLQVTSGAVSQTVDILREAGLVTSEVNPADRRGRFLRLTSDARIEVNQFQQSYLEGIAPRFASLSLEEIFELDRILAILSDRRENNE
jgi:DNA-binding MarR family transcriptional regulator